MNIADILDKAADLIEPEGAWTQESFEDDLQRRCWCIVGAIGVAAFGRGCWEEAEALVDRNQHLFGAYAEALEEWNDAPERTQPEVVAKLRETATKAREQGL
jgi:hypothetical protein